MRITKRKPWLMKGTEGPRLTRILGLGKKPCYMKLVLVGLYCGPLLTLIPPLTLDSANRNLRLF